MLQALCGYVASGSFGWVFEKNWRWSFFFYLSQRTGLIEISLDNTKETRIPVLVD